MRARLWALAGAVLLSGCASGPGGLPLPEGPPRLFISPSGQPFRYNSQTPDPIQAWFAGADADRDGRMTAAEFYADGDRFFATLDTDGDGRIDAFENQRYEREVIPELGQDPFGLRAPPPAAETPSGERDIIRLPPRLEAPRRGEGGGGAGAAASVTGDPQPIRAADADVSQAVTRGEFRALAERHFTRLDTDRDGSVTWMELPEPRTLPGPDGAGGGRRFPGYTRSAAPTR